MRVLLLVLFCSIFSNSAWTAEINNSEKSIIVDLDDLQSNSIALYRNQVWGFKKDDVPLRIAYLIGGSKHWTLGVTINSLENVTYYMPCNRITESSLLECAEYRNFLREELRLDKRIKMYFQGGRINKIDIID